MPQSAEITASLDIVIDAKSFEKYSKRIPRVLVEEPDLPVSSLFNKFRKIGTCSINKTIDCQSIINDLLNINKRSDRLDSTQSNYDNICELLKDSAAVPITSIDYYFVYHFAQEPQTIKFTINEETGEVNEQSTPPINGVIDLVPFEPSSTDDQYGFPGSAPTKITCDPCRSYFSIPANAPKYKPSPESEPIEPPPKIGAFYDGFNDWLYTKYYGGKQYDIIFTNRDKAGFVGINIGKAFTVNVKIKKVKERNPGGTYSKNVIGLTISGGDLGLINKSEFWQLAPKDGKPQGYTKAPKDGRIPPGSSKDDFINDGTNPKTFLANHSKPLEIDCCPDAEVENTKMQVGKIDTATGKVSNPEISIDKIQRAHGGLFSNAPKKSPCCEDCEQKGYVPSGLYCLLGNLCPEIADIFSKLRRKEVAIRDASDHPWSDVRRGAENYGIDSPLISGPQCVIKNLNTGKPIDIKDLEIK